jgi:hypothetical protein
MLAGMTKLVSNARWGFDYGVFREAPVNPLNGPGVQKGA